MSCLSRWPFKAVSVERGRLSALTSCALNYQIFAKVWFCLIAGVPKRTSIATAYLPKNINRTEGPENTQSGPSDGTTHDTWRGSRMKLGFSVAVFVFIAATRILAQDYSTQATAAWLYDVTTKSVLVEKNAAEPLPPASMSKLMTLLMLFEALRDGRVTMETEFAVSLRAQSIGGSTMFLNTADRPTVRELILGIIVNSGNDACIVVAEGLAGSEENFAIQMTKRGREIGLKNSTFANATGWPDPRHRMSVEDLGRVAVRLIEEFPEYYPMFSVMENDFGGRSPANRFNRNPLLWMGLGADGLKTGWTDEAGFGVVGSVVQGNRRVVSVITGLQSAEARSREAEMLSNWAFRQYTLRRLASAGDTITSAKVFLGETDTVPLVLGSNIEALVPVGSQGDLKAEAVFVEPLFAPIQEGQVVGDLIVGNSDREIARAPLIAAQNVEEGGFQVRVEAAAQKLLGMLWAQVAKQ